MSGVLDLLQGPIGQQVINGVAGATGYNENKISSVLSMGVPVLMKAMQRNASTTEGAQGLLGALTKHAGSGVLDNVSGMFTGGANSLVSQEGNKILGHILGSKQSGVTSLIAQKLGLDSGAVSSILQMAAPLLMELIGKQAVSNSVTDEGGLANVITGLLGGSEAQADQSMLEKILDSDGDGSVIDDVAGMFLGGNKSKSSEGDLLGGVLGSVFGKK